MLTLYGCTGQAQTNCSAEDFKDNLLKASYDWGPSKTLGVDEPPQPSTSGRAKVVPVTGISVRDGAVWVSTYRSDFSPVDIRVFDGRLRLQRLRFLAPIPGGAANQPAILVKPYADTNVQFSLASIEKDCTSESIVLTIDNVQTTAGAKSVRWLFIQNKDE